ncbi:hypothetical protein [Cryobacterium sp. CG_9.6]|uniref:hypothetical protein n=1 Tax=Cryobacterium sp. CG_9.6 TaxID=2760710 RepID=UPI002476590B|nr:hypothetical protein [Cryobacterium sp. CG_9.6]MDH6236276.1 hypothetical protein [Cryobacterium sp. CG_9.6]
MTAKLETSVLDTSRRQVGSIAWIGVHLLAVNRSDRAGALVSARLEVTYRVEGAPIVAQIPTTTTDTFEKFGNSLILPLALPANGAAKGWITFACPAGLIPSPVDRYEVKIVDSRGLVEAMDIWALRSTVG